VRERSAERSLVVRDGEGQVDAARAAAVDDAAGGLENGWVGTKNNIYKGFRNGTYAESLKSNVAF
jgi:hypothetical protein